ncbi:hypothetical protein [Phytopseudomonas dryadis]|uniref:Uncharacterized protein n=1 Tax=Phytopseudomonas dryadis TaxID=2487520 RepID=A0ABY1Z6Y6_9GAMM|nr:MULTISPECIES: hypothetical protein [Pseudomonas]TBV06738.1 hypothetical protein DNK34_10430 [Pseudomonas dryadis]TBV18573.1 hypothetical protein DNK41_07730 [Pseudomonas sp. FRB 230]
MAETGLLLLEYEMSHLKKPLIAIILAIIPFFVFLGSQDTVRVNGVVTADNRFNILGVVLGLVAVGMALSILKPSASGSVARKALGALAGLLGVVQVVAAFDVVRIDPWDWLLPDRNLPELTYTRLGPDARPQILVRPDTAEGYSGALRRNKVLMIIYTRSHMDYADLCHGGRYRVDTQEALSIPDFLPQEEQDAIVAETERRRSDPPAECGPGQTARQMGSLVDEINRDLDASVFLKEEYLKRAQAQ